MTVDVLFPYYGDVELMKKAVLSVLNQSNKDFRLIVVDDGYPDDSIPGWFESLNDDRVSYERNEKNLGANGNYRKCLTKIENDIAVVMGADDIMLPNYLDWVIKSAEEYPQVDVFQPGVVAIDENGAFSNTLVEKMKAFYRPKGAGAKVLKGEQAAVSLLRGAWMYFPSLAWRTDKMTEINFRPEYNVVQDLTLVLDIIKAGGSLLLDDEITFLYRRHSGSDSSWSALEGTRFAEERDFFYTMSKEMADLGWNKASRVAKLHVSSRLHALTLLPKAAMKGNKVGVKNLSAHIFK